MNAAMQAPNMVPKGAIRLSEAFDRLCAKLDPEWSELPDLCGRWDDLIAQGEEDLGEDPYRRVFEVEYRAERLFRWTLASGELSAFIHNLRTGVDLELHRSDWRRMGENVGIHSDYTDDRTPGPDCSLDGVPHPIFLLRDQFDDWLKKGDQGVPGGQMAASRHADLLHDTRAYSLEEITERTGLSRTTLYAEIQQKHLVAKKCGNRTLVLESDLNRFLQNLPSL